VDAVDAKLATGEWLSTGRRSRCITAMAATIPRDVGRSRFVFLFSHCDRSEPQVPVKNGTNGNMDRTIGNASVIEDL
jgi:hypothetical protein